MPSGSRRGLVLRSPLARTCGQFLATDTSLFIFQPHSPDFSHSFIIHDRPSIVAVLIPRFHCIASPTFVAVSAGESLPFPLSILLGERVLGNLGAHRTFLYLSQRQQILNRVPQPRYTLHQLRNVGRIRVDGFDTRFMFFVRLAIVRSHRHPTISPEPL